MVKIDGCVFVILMVDEEFLVKKRLIGFVARHNVVPLYYVDVKGNMDVYVDVYVYVDAVERLVMIKTVKMIITVLLLHLSLNN